MATSTLLLVLLLGLAVGCGITYWLLRGKSHGLLDQLSANHARELEERERRMGEMRADLQQRDSDLRNAEQRLSTELAKAEAREEKLKEQTAYLNELNERMKGEFKVIAAELLQEKGKELNERQDKSLNDTLKPFKERIKDFEDLVRKVYTEEGKERFALKKEIAALVENNQKLSADAVNLTRALKGDAQAQGAWGEMILESLLESSGLVKGSEYAMQDSHTLEDHTRQRTDAVIYLPDNKSIVIDSKVSITHYEQFATSSDESQRSRLLRAHVDSMRAHAKGLAAKEYSKLYGLQAIDFVLMFVPIEPAFLLALKEHPEIFQEAYERGVVMVSHSTLMVTLKTVASIWKNERVAQNHLEIAERAGALYEKFVGFTEDLGRIGKNVADANESYQKALGKLSEGPGNLVRQVEMIKKLGAKTNKNLHSKLLERSLEEENTTGA
ncbi:MAG: DNA recombination protein RmuC [Flavobacteriales bacterium]